VPFTHIFLPMVIYYNMEKKQTLKIIISSAFILLVAVLGSIFVNLGMEWFGGLEKPSEWVPNFIIPIMWTIIYLSFAIINFLWFRKGEIPRKIIILMIVNSIFNVLWCLVFFTLNQLLIGNIVIVLNLVLGYVLVVNILRVKPIYGYILSVYPIWLSLATTLNTAVWILN